MWCVLAIEGPNLEGNLISIPRIILSFLWIARKYQYNGTARDLVVFSIHHACTECPSTLQLVIQAHLIYYGSERLLITG